MTWAQFIVGVMGRLTDNEPDEASFTEAQAEYVAARISLARGDAPGYQIHQNKFTSIRRKQAGFLTAMNAAAQQAAVRLLLSSATASDSLFEQAASFYVKAQVQRDGNRDAGLAKQFMDDYNELRNTRLLGYTYTGNDAALLAAVIASFYVTTSTAANTAYLTAMTAAARRDLEAQAAWFNGQVAAAASDLQGLHDRVIKEIRAAVIAIQTIIPGYRVGHTSVFNEDNTTVEGFAALGAMPDQAQIRDAWMIFPPAAVRVVNEGMLTEGDDGGIARGDLAWLMTDTTICRRRQCVVVPWSERLDAMVARETSWPLLAIEAPYATQFLVAGQLLAASRELELTWDGLKVDFADGDTVPFDDGVEECAAFYVQKALALEFGDTQGVVQAFERDFSRRQAMLYVTMMNRGNAVLPAVRSGGWPAGDWDMNAWRNSLTADNWCEPHPVALPTDASSFWLQLLDSDPGTVWKTIYFTGGVFTNGPWDWRNEAPALTARVSTGFLQLWDVTNEAWRSVWWVNGVLTAGAPSTAGNDGAAATAVWIDLDDGVTTLQLADSAHAGQSRALFLVGGVATAGPLVTR